MGRPSSLWSGLPGGMPSASTTFILGAKPPRRLEAVHPAVSTRCIPRYRFRSRAADDAELLAPTDIKPTPSWAHCPLPHSRTDVYIHQYPYKLGIFHMLGLAVVVTFRLGRQRFHSESRTHETSLEKQRAKTDAVGRSSSSHAQVGALATVEQVWELDARLLAQDPPSTSCAPSLSRPSRNTGSCPS